MGSVPTPRTFVASEVETAAFMNSLGSVLNFLLNPPRAKAYNSVGLSLANATFTAVPMDTEVYDTDGIHSTSSNTDRFTIQTPGLYHCVGTVNFGSNATGGRLVRLTKNGVQVNADEAGPASGVGTELTCSADVQCAAGDYIQVQAYQSSGAALSTGSGDGSVFCTVRWTAAS